MSWAAVVCQCGDDDTDHNNLGACREADCECTSFVFGHEIGEDGEIVNDWSETTDGVSVGECDRCGETRWVLLSGDPYIEEIYPEQDNPETLWCRRCYYEIADEI